MSGWKFNTVSKPKTVFIAECVFELEREYKIFKKVVLGGNVWLVARRLEDGDTIISLYMIEKRCGCWGYKRVDEIEHPPQLDFPLRFLAILPQLRTKNGD